MYQEERLRRILEWLKSEQALSNQDLMERLEISRDTARRDIIKLSEAGKGNSHSWRNCKNGFSSSCGKLPVPDDAECGRETKNWKKSSRITGRERNLHFLIRQLICRMYVMH